MKLNWTSILLLSGLFGITGVICADPVTYTYTPISVPGGSSTSARALNNAGQIVGAYTDSAGQTHGFLDTNDVYTTVDAPGGTATTLLGINNLGQIVGTYLDTTNTTRLFLDNHGTFTTINPPGASRPVPTAIFREGLQRVLTTKEKSSAQPLSRTWAPPWVLCTPMVSLPTFLP